MIAADALSALHLFAAAPFGTGLVLRGAPCPARDAILAALGRAAPLRRLPLHTATDRLTGGIDLALSIARGREIAQQGVLDGDPAVLVMAMAERWDAPRAALLAAALDTGRFGLIALDEGIDGEAIPPALADRCAYRLDVGALPDDFAPSIPPQAACAQYPKSAAIDPVFTTVLCEAALAFGVASLRAAQAASRCACLAATQAGRAEVAEEDAALAARLVLAPRATTLPLPRDDAAADTPPDAPDHHPPDHHPPELEEPPADADGGDPGLPDLQSRPDLQSLTELILDAVRVTLPPNLLPRAASASAHPPAKAQPGKAQAMRGGGGKGRPIGSRPGTPGHGLRLDLVATLRAAAPWQTLRGRADATHRLLVRPADLRVLRCRPRTATTTIFAVDASGSQALARLNEAKGAVELLLAQCYVRRDQVALIGFRGRTAEILLPPTRAPARARACLAVLPGGGGTPLAAGLEAAAGLAGRERRRGCTPSIVMLTDGQANIARDGTPGRARARDDALAMAAEIRDAGHAAVLIDTAQRHHPEAEALARAMGARYLALPRADAQALSRAVRAVTA